ncbi:hypothetical protein B0H11DRAFT_2260960 [Mycena galericulata]|nr:hypothetical protein B0H11DRAFT_2260960 [Mycena galericulata]
MQARCQDQIGTITIRAIYRRRLSSHRLPTCVLALAVTEDMQVTLAAPFLLTFALVSTQTLYGVISPEQASESLPGGLTVSAGGVGPDGWTTYIFVDPEPAEATTGTVTLAEGADGLRATVPAETCTFGANGVGECFLQLVVGSSTLVNGSLSFSGNVEPVYTLTPAGPEPSTTMSTTGSGESTSAGSVSVTPLPSAASSTARSTTTSPSTATSASAGHTVTSAPQSANVTPSTRGSSTSAGGPLASPAQVTSPLGTGKSANAGKPLKALMFPGAPCVLVAFMFVLL